MKRWIAVVVVVVMVAVVTSALGATRQVNCAIPGQTISKTLETVMPGDIIQVSGTCSETVTITTDRITLDGGGTAVIDGGGVAGQPGDVFEGLLTVDGAQGVIITGLTVQNSSTDGILVQKGAATTVQNTTVTGSADDGIQVSENATAQLINCTVEGSGEFGIAVVFGSVIRVIDNLMSQNNMSHGILISGASQATLSSGTIQVNQNGAFGILVFTSSSLSINRTGPTVIANGNMTDGILVAENAQFRVAGGTLTASQNGRDGLRAVASSIFVIAGGVVNLSENTRHGVSADAGSQAQKLPPGELNIQNNQVSGITADVGSIVNLLGAATITDNGPADAGSDVNLSFGTMANVSGENNLGVITCDDTALLRGNTGLSCPTP